MSCTIYGCCGLAPSLCCLRHVPLDVLRGARAAPLLEHSLYVAQCCHCCDFKGCLDVYQHVMPTLVNALIISIVLIQQNISNKVVQVLYKDFQQAACTCAGCHVACGTAKPRNPASFPLNHITYCAAAILVTRRRVYDNPKSASCICAGVSPHAACHLPAHLPAVQPPLRPGHAVGHLRRLQSGSAQADQLQADHQPLPSAAAGQV